jgi:hypothetical protein
VDEGDDDDEDDDDDHSQLKQSVLGKRRSSNETFDIDTNRHGTRSGAKHQFNSLAQGAINVVKKYTASKKTARHVQFNQAVTSRRKKYYIMEENLETGEIETARCVTQDSQSYDAVNTIAKDGKAIEMDSQPIPIELDSQPNPI